MYGLGIKSRAVKKFLKSRLIVNIRRLWNSHQRNKFLRAETSRVILSLGNGVSSGFQEVFSTAETMLFSQNICKTGNNAVEMYQAFQDIARFELFRDLNLFKYAFNVIRFKTRKGMLYIFIRWCFFY